MEWLFARNFGIRDPFTSMPYRQLLRLLYHEQLNGLTSEAAEQWIAELNAPLPTVGETAGADDEMVATLIADGLARDAHEARAWLAHQEVLAGIADPQSRAQANHRFATERKARRARLTAERSSDTDR